MKYPFILLLILVLSHNAYGQYKSGKIVYQVAPPKNLSAYKDTTAMKNATARIMAKRDFKKVRQAAKRLRLLLLFNREEALFTAPNSVIDSVEKWNGPAFKVAHGIFYSNLHKKIHIRQLKAFQTIYRVKLFDTLNWVKHPETKTIKGYLCKKASLNLDKNKDKTKTIIAWYSPAIPFRHGPMGYGSLPGAILELERKNFRFYAVDIHLSKDKVSIDKPKKGKYVTPKEFRRAIDRDLEKHLKQRRSSTKKGNKKVLPSDKP